MPKENHEDDFKDVYVYSDGEIYDTPQSWKSDDYEIRETMLCEDCDTEVEPWYGIPFASCKCHAMEWGR